MGGATDPNKWSPRYVPLRSCPSLFRLGLSNSGKTFRVRLPQSWSPPARTCQDDFTCIVRRYPLLCLVPAPSWRILYSSIVYSWGSSERPIMAKGNRFAVFGSAFASHTPKHLE